MNFGHDDSSLGAKSFATAAEKLMPLVLVVDDADSVRYCFNILLRAKGYRVLEAENGVAAQAILLLAHPALVICDLEMPICDGWDLLAYCHKHYPDLPMLVTSGDGLGKRPEIECWASGFLPKPFTVSEFQTEIQRLLPRAA